MKHLVADIAEQALERPNAESIQSLLGALPSNARTIPHSSESYHVNTNVAFWKNFLNNRPTNLAIYFNVDRKNACGLTFSGEYREFSRTAAAPDGMY